MVALCWVCNAVLVWVRSGAWVYACVSDAAHALGAPDGQIVSGWRGQGIAHGRSRAKAIWGIDPGREREAGGEVTAREMVGAVWPTMGVHGGHGDVHRHRRGIASGLCGMGSRETVGRNDTSPLGVGHGGGIEQNRGTGFW
jgi:hypothetical protein